MKDLTDFINFSPSQYSYLLTKKETRFAFAKKEPSGILAVMSADFTFSGDATLCPLCGRPNGCRLATDASYKGPCWCSTHTIPRELIARVPEAAQRKACICRACVEEWNASHP